MEKLELEKLLEDGLHALGIKFQHRMYSEEFRMGAEIDDVLVGTSIDELNDKMKDYSPEEKLLHNMFGDGADISELQQRVQDGMIPFFSRKSSDYNGIFIKYEVYSTEKLEEYEPQADRLVKEGKIESEEIFIHLSGSESYLGLIIIDHVNPDTKDNINVNAYLSWEDSLLYQDLPKSEFGRLDWGLRRLRGINAHHYKAEKVYKAMMDFLNDITLS